jgi:hypothetical protein
MTAAVARLSAALEAAGCTVRGTSATCPAHDDRNASLSIGQGRTGALLHCHAGCPTDEVLEALGMSAANLFDNHTDSRDRDSWTPHGPATEVFDYTDENGILLFQVCRTADKKFSQRVPDPAARSGYRWRLDGVRRVLYHLPRLIAACQVRGPLLGELSACVFVVEGERDVHALEAAGETATCNPGGAGKWRSEYSRYLAGVDVLVVADRDKPGRDHAWAVYQDVRPLARSAWIVQAAEGKDARDHLEAGHDVTQFVWWSL